MSEAIKFYMDEHVPVSVTKELRRLGVDVRTTQEEGHRAAEDSVQLAFAASEGRILVTQNAKHFLPLHRAGVPHAGLIIAGKDVTPSLYIKALKLVAGASTPEEWVGRIDSITQLASYD